MLEAYRLWLTFDDRTDDITIIVLMIKDFITIMQEGQIQVQTQENKNDNDNKVDVKSELQTNTMSIQIPNKPVVNNPNINNLNNPTSSTCTAGEYVGKPVRRAMSSQKQKIISESWSKEEKPFIYAEHIVQKVGHHSVCMSVCLYVCLSVCLSVCLTVYLFVCLSVCLTVCLTVCMFVCLSVCLSACHSVCVYFLNCF